MWKIGLALCLAAAAASCATAVRTTAGVATTTVGVGARVAASGVRTVGGVLIPDDEYEKCEKIRNRSRREQCFEDAVEAAQAAREAETAE